MLCSLNMSGSFQMTVESSDVIAIASLSDWLKILTPVFLQMRSKTKTSRPLHARLFLRFEQVIGTFFVFSC